MALGLVTVFLYVALRELQTERRLAFVIVLIFGLLPHYSTDRFFTPRGCTERSICHARVIYIAEIGSCIRTTFENLDGYRYLRAAPFDSLLRSRPRIDCRVLSSDHMA